MSNLPATYLGELELSPHAILRGLEQPSLTYENKRTIGGRLVYYHAIAIKGRTLTLDLLEGHTTPRQLDYIRDLIDAGKPVTLRHHVWSGLVRVDSIESENPPIDYADTNDDDWASVEIKMTEL